MKADFFSDPEDKRIMAQQRTVIENLNDFIVWLFEESGELNCISLTEAGELYDKYLESL